MIKYTKFKNMNLFMFAVSMVTIMVIYLAKIPVPSFKLPTRLFLWIRTYLLHRNTSISIHGGMTKTLQFVVKNVRNVIVYSSCTCICLKIVFSKYYKSSYIMYIYRHHLENLLSVRLSPYSIKHTQSNKPCQTIAHYITKFNALK